MRIDASGLGAGHQPPPSCRPCATVATAPDRRARRVWSQVETDIAHVGADHLHGADPLRPLADAEADAADQAAADQAGRQVLGRLGRRRRRRRGEGGALRGRSSSCAIPSASTRSARPSPRASCSTARPAPARRCSPRRSRRSPGAEFFSQSAAAFVEMFAGLGAARIRRLFAEARAHRAGRDLHRRDRRRRRRARRGQQLRARADAQPAARRDGRLQQHRRPRRDRRLEPAREARRGAAAPRAASTARSSSRRPTSPAARRS